MLFATTRHPLVLPLASGVPRTEKRVTEKGHRPGLRILSDPTPFSPRQILTELLPGLTPPKMLRTAQKLRSVITIYHNPRIEASINLVKYANKRFSDPELHHFDLQIDEGNPTEDQLATLKSFTPMLTSVKQADKLPRPTLVSWFNGKVAVDNELRAKAIINSADAEWKENDN